MADGLPSGTVTFLFTDIEDSTRRWDDAPTAMSSALARHDELLRRAVSASGGAVFATAGDGMAVVFDRAGDAIQAALTAQRMFAAEPWPVVMRVRMGVHTGEAEERDGDYFGGAVNRTARLMAEAAGGQILVSLSAAEVVRDRLPDGVALVELGERALRSLRRPERVFELTWSPVTRQDLSVEVLGPLRVFVGGVEVGVVGPKRRAVLALLAWSSPAPLSVDRLVDSLSLDGGGHSGRAALQSHVSRLRRQFGPVASRLDNTPGGYRLCLDPGELDVARAVELLDEARRLAGVDPVAARQLVRDAKGLWRGRPLDEFADVDALAGWARSLEELRSTAADLHAELALDIGDWADAIAVTTAAVADDDLRESSVLLLMRALAGAGRAADALRAGHNFRKRLAGRTGLQPSDALAGLEHRIAAGHPDQRDGPVTPPTTANSSASGTDRPRRRTGRHRQAHRNGQPRHPRRTRRRRQDLPRRGDGASRSDRPGSDRDQPRLGERPDRAGRCARRGPRSARQHRRSADSRSRTPAIPGLAPRDRQLRAPAPQRS